MRDPGAVVFGIGGHHMAAAGVEIDFVSDHLGAVGVTEALASFPSLPGALWRIRRVSGGTTLKWRYWLETTCSTSAWQDGSSPKVYDASCTFRRRLAVAASREGDCKELRRHPCFVSRRARHLSQRVTRDGGPVRRSLSRRFAASADRRRPTRGACALSVSPRSKKSWACSLVAAGMRFAPSCL